MDERSIEIVNRFVKSWEQVQARFTDLIENHPGFERLIPIVDFMRRMRDTGENKFFCASTSVHILILSRSVDGGLRVDQKRLRIEAISSNDFEITLCDGAVKYRQYRIKDLSDERLFKLLKTLKDTLAD